MDVLKARDTFYRWTEICLDQYLSGLTEQQQFAIRLIPLIFQTNHRTLPAYASADTPAGIYGYKPDKLLLREARKINNRFAYDQQTVLKNTIIDALYLQLSVLDYSVKLVLIHKPEIKAEQKKLIQNKMGRVIHWLESEQLHITGRVLTPEQLVSTSEADSLAQYQAGSSGIDHFYIEAILLAGKYPLWWLIPPDADLNYRKMVQQIEQAHYVNENEYLDFGPASEFNINKVLNLVTNLLRQGSASETLLPCYCLSWQGLQMKSTGLLSAVLKSEIFETQKDIQLLSVRQIYIQLLRQIMITLFGQGESEKIGGLYSVLMPFADNINRDFLLELSGHREHSHKLSDNAEINLAVFLEAKLDLQSFISVAAARIVEQLISLDVEENDIDLLTQLLEVYNTQFNSPDLVVVLNQKKITSIVQEKILIREIPSAKDSSQWALVAKDKQGDAQLLYQLSSLLALIAWAWLNRIINQNTQVSIDCPGHQVKQIEVRYALEVLVRQLSDDFWQQIKKHRTDEPDWAAKSLVFVRLISAAEAEVLIDDGLQHYSNTPRQVLLFEQINVNRWGDVHYRMFYDDEGIVICLCDWFNNVDLKDPHIRDNFKLFSYSSGEANYHVQQLTQAYDEMTGFFIDHRGEQASYILRMGIHFFVISQQHRQFSYQKIDSKLALYQYLELADQSFKSFFLQQHVLSETPLAMLYQKNRTNIVQFCFQGRHDQYDIWVLDERGSLWHSKSSIIDFERLIAHWLLFIRNIASQYQKAAITMPRIELFISDSRASGEFKLSKLNTDGMSVKLTEPSLSVKCQDLVKGDELSLQIEDISFDYLEYGDDVIDQCADYIAHNAQTLLPLVSDISLNVISPGSIAAEEIQFVHFLKLKRRVEFELRQLLPGHQL